MKFCPECGTKITEKEIDNSKRFVCEEHGCSYVHWNNPIPVVAALVKHNEKYLMEMFLGDVEPLSLVMFQL